MQKKKKNPFIGKGREKRGKKGTPGPGGFMEFGLLWNAHQGLGTVSSFSWGAQRLEFHMLVPIFFWCWQSCLFYWKHLPQALIISRALLQTSAFQKPSTKPFFTSLWPASKGLGLTGVLWAEDVFRRKNTNNFDTSSQIFCHRLMLTSLSDVWS